MGETEPPHFYDFGIFEPVTKPQNQLFLFLDTPEHSPKIKFHFLKRWAPENDEDPFTNVLKISNMGPIST